MSSRPRRERRDKEGGAAAVEFALLLPLLLLLVFGIVQYGVYFWTMQGGSDIARDAARMSAVGVPPTCEGFQDEVRLQVESLNGAGESATITRTYSVAPNELNVGDTVEVRVEFPAADLQLPFLPFVNDGLVATTAQARVEYVPSIPESCA